VADLSDKELLKLLDADAETTETLIAVEGASGTEFHVISNEEARWFTSTLDRYHKQYDFDNIADLQDLDRLTALELLSYRYAAWLIRESDYEGNVFDEKAVREHKDKVDKEIRNIKAHMGIGRKTRVESEQQSVAEYLTDLLNRAKEFGVHRDEQVAKATDLFNELKTQVGLYRRSDEEERKHLHVEMDDIFEWIETVAIPEYDRIDDAFRKNQKIWIQDIG
jgi:hypothetical protein